MSQQESPEPPHDPVPGTTASTGPGIVGPPPPGAAPYPADPAGPPGAAVAGAPGDARPANGGPAGPAVVTPGGARPALGLLRGDDPLLPHLAWEAVLLVLAVLSVIVTVVAAPGGPVAEQLLRNTASIGLVASAVAVSFRTGTPNLAAGAMTTVAGLLTIHLVAAQHWGELTAGAAAVLVVTVIGLVLGGITGLLSVPGWAVTAGGMVLLVGIAFLATGARAVALDGGTGAPSGVLWFVLFAVVSLGGAGLWLVPPVRRTLSAVRHPGDPSAWNAPGAFGALAGLTLSGLLCGLAGALQAYQYRAMSLNDGITVLTIAMAAALLGGASVFGRRAGLTGTVLASLILAGIVTTFALQGVSEPGGELTVAGVAIIVGLGVNRGLELLSSLLSRRAGARRPGLPTVAAAPPGARP
ncbi:hypothetical protein Athai_55140 [Actinocatenispora thailandica]|uniref:ABC transporter permease n=1 Tax=Actinocatenispora thailandica TaxID=227318 RepID=A0A7R7DUI2_9ACTN|nr:hypothetical protein [Actinocatenispora thailandica]BCJ38011.1 hypothetical protein Athai_55140 [Actinocatenispora thailandica]